MQPSGCASGRFATLAGMSDLEAWATRKAREIVADATATYEDLSYDQLLSIYSAAAQEIDRRQTLDLVDEDEQT